MSSSLNDETKYTIISNHTPLGIQESDLRTFFQRFGPLATKGGGVRFYRDKKRFGVEFISPKSALKCFKTLYKKPNNDLFGLLGGIWEIYFGNDIKLFAQQKSVKLPCSDYDPFRNREERQLAINTPEVAKPKDISRSVKRPVATTSTAVDSQPKKAKTKLVRRKAKSEVDTVSLLDTEATASAIPSILRSADILAKVSSCLAHYDSSLLGLNKIKRVHPSDIMEANAASGAPAINEGSYAEVIRGVYRSAKLCNLDDTLTPAMSIPATMKTEELQVACNLLGYSWQDLSSVGVYKNRRPLSFGLYTNNLFYND